MNANPPVIKKIFGFDVPKTKILVPIFTEIAQRSVRNRFGRCLKGQITKKITESVRNQI